MRHEGIVFSDQARFYWTGSVNMHNYHYYNTNSRYPTRRDIEIKGGQLSLRMVFYLMTYHVRQWLQVGSNQSVLTNHIIVWYYYYDGEIWCFYSWAWNRRLVQLKTKFSLLLWALFTTKWQQITQIPFFVRYVFLKRKKYDRLIQHNIYVL